jgi:phosphohistidine phosphatase
VPQRRLVLVRHAQDGDAATDRDRPLTEHGLRQAQAVGEWLARTGIAPDRVLVSPALRTRQTWEQARAALDCGPEPDADERIYDNTLDGLLEVLRELDEDVQTLVLVGHNPAVGTLAHELDDGEGSEAARRDLAAGFPPASVAVFEVGTPFADLDEAGATLVDIMVAPG